MDTCLIHIVQVIQVGLDCGLAKPSGPRRFLLECRRAHCSDPLDAQSGPAHGYFACQRSSNRKIGAAQSPLEIGGTEAPQVIFDQVMTNSWLVCWQDAPRGKNLCMDWR